MTLGYIGLGKMGANMVLRLLKKRHRVIVFDPDSRARAKAARSGAVNAGSIKELTGKLKPPGVIWIMTPHAAVDSVLKELVKYLSRGDIVIDGGNSFYRDSIRRAKRLAERGVCFVDVGVSGGPSGARNGACLMIGGRLSDCQKLEKLFSDLAVPGGYGYVGKSGAGHFVKMVHNGIEYGIMQAIAEGFSVMKKSEYRLNLREVADLYNHGSVIESRLISWLGKTYREYGENLSKISGAVAHTGEGEWTIKTAKKLGVPAPVIKAAFGFRVRSKKNPSYAGKILSALRNQFGGHKVR